MTLGYDKEDKKDNRLILPDANDHSFKEEKKWKRMMRRLAFHEFLREWFLTILIAGGLLIFILWQFMQGLSGSVQIVP